MTRKLTVISLIVGLCLMGVIPVLAQKTYPTLADYEKLTGKRIEAFNEAPSLKTKVAAGEIPSAEERLPQEPMVVEPLEEIGQYGGELRTGVRSPYGFGADSITPRLQHLFTLSPDLRTTLPNIAKGWDFSKDCKSFTVYLRKGMKWNDGAPFTADDIMFWYEDIILNDELTPVKPKIWSPGGKLVKVEKIDDYIVRFQFVVPYPPVINILAVGQGGDTFAPKHYLKKYHIKYNPKANEVAKEERYDYWWKCFNFHKDGGQGQQDVNLPTVNPWVLKKIAANQYKYFERNPYYWKIDATGNQLPYIDRQTKVIVETIEVLILKIIAGEFSVAGRYLPLENYTLFKQGEKKGNYHTMLWGSCRGSEFRVFFNLTHKDPVLKKIFNDIRFRQAMSLAINREEMNQIFWFGKAIPRQATALPTCSFYEPWMGKYYAEYDPERANHLLDEMGLDKRDKDDYRLRPDGKTLAITLETGPWENYPKLCEVVKDYWEKVGVKVAVKVEEPSLYNKRGLANERDAGDWGFESTEFRMYVTPTFFRPPWAGAGGAAVEWWNWYKTDGRTGEEPPEVVRRLFKLIEKWQTTLPGIGEYKRLGKEILTINVKNLFSIGTCGMSPQPVNVKNNLKNIPKQGFSGSHWNFWQPYQADQWFFKK